MALPFVENDFSSWQRWLIGVVLSLLAIFGFFGNMTVCITFSRRKNLQTSTNILIVNLAIADILQSLNMTFMISSASLVKWFRIRGWCQMNAFANATFIGTSILSLSFISLNRYFVIVKTSDRNIFTKRNTFFFVFVAWFIATILGISPVLGWSKYQFRAGYLSCLLESRPRISYMIAFCIILLIIPLSIMCFCSWKIMVTMKQNRQRLQQTAKVSRKFREQGRVTAMLSSVIISFFILYAPFWIINIVEMFSGDNFKIKPWIEVSATMFAMLNHVNNPIIYGLLNRNYRKAFLEIFCWKKFWKTQSTKTSIEIQSLTDTNT